LIEAMAGRSSIRRIVMSNGAKNKRARRFLLSGLAAVLGFAASGANAAPLAVVELFTSQGCSSCPPAHDNFNALSDRSDILALSFGVTYWDNLGWKDTFAQPAFTARQVAYAHSLHHDGPFTPQVVVDGRSDVVGARKGEIEQLVGRTQLQGGPSIEIKGDDVVLGAAHAQGPAADVWLVRYDPRTVQVPIKAGENDGRTLPQKNVVRELVRLGGWSGAAEHFQAPQGKPGLVTAVLVQTSGAGPILSAAKG
jgi:hypothetical protein